MTHRIHLTDKQEKKIRRIIRENQDKPNVLKRAYCILLRNEGQPNRNITQLLNIHEDTIADWAKLYKRRGLRALLNFRYDKRRSSQLDPYKAKIKRIASNKSVNTIEKLQEEIKERFDIEVEYSWFYRYCKRNGIYSNIKNKDSCSRI